MVPGWGWSAILFVEDCLWFLGRIYSIWLLSNGKAFRRRGRDSDKVRVR